MKFTDGGTTIEVVAHIDRHSDVIDKLMLVEVKGSRADGERLFAKIAETYRGQPYATWGTQRLETSHV